MAVANVITPPRAVVYRVAVLSAGHLVNDSYAYFLAALLPLIILNLNLSLTLAGLLVAAYQLTSSLVQPLLGHLIDQGDRRWFAYAGLALCGVANALLLVMPSYPLLLAVVLLAGLGSSGFHPAGIAMAIAASRAHRGMLMSIFMTAGNVGLALGPLAIAAVLTFGGAAYIPLLGLPAVVVSLLLLQNNPPSNTKGRDETPLSLIAALRVGGAPLLKTLVVVSIRSIVAESTVRLLPVLFVLRNQSKEEGAVVLSAFLICGALGGLIGGALSDRFGRTPVIVASLLLSPPALWAMFSDIGPLIWIGSALSGLLLNGSFIVMTVKAADLMPRSVGVASGLMLGLTLGIGGLSVAPIAAIGDQIGLEPVMKSLVVVPLICALLALTIDRGTKPELAAKTG